ncbi:hypothetical protein FRB96_002356 [Tulasnella sp. 330]|nr:hypothetical protein FRB96_002356 [Tulasnella sp. 330]KAG8879207.1 hypothetical protein FRB97_001874 [Tulasnella sp. 331]KAG8885219.1 hypothetical protein FRB98_001901 [Tulasnella sp. 332]
MSDPAILNAILRTYYSNSNFSPLIPPAIAPVEVDHFFEVQHMIELLFQHPPLLNPNSWYDVPIGQFVDLATFVNDHRNMFQITRAENQAKKLIPLAQYPHNAVIQAYLARQVSFQGQVVTVLAMVQAMAREMRARNTPFGNLTRGVGTRLCAVMGW